MFGDFITQLNVRLDKLNQMVHTVTPEIVPGKDEKNGNYSCAFSLGYFQHIKQQQEKHTGYSRR